MKLLTLMRNNQTVLGVDTEKGVVDLSSALSVVPSENIPTDIMTVISVGPSAVRQIENYLENLDLTNDEYVLNEKDIQWGPSVPEPKKIICVGLNYRRHADETNAPY